MTAKYLLDSDLLGDGVGMSESAVAATVIVFLVVWFLLMFPSVLPLGRPASALVGGALVTGIRRIDTSAHGTPVFDAIVHIDLDPICLLFGLMLVRLIKFILLF